MKNVLSAGMILVLTGLTLVASGADFNGDGIDDITIFRPSSGLWAIRAISRAYFGGYGDIPAPGKWSQTSRDEIGIFRPSNGLWAVQGGARNYFGAAGDIPIVKAGSGSWLQCGTGIYYNLGTVGIGVSLPLVDLGLGWCEVGRSRNVEKKEWVCNS